jgi:hypothetical protein
MQHDTSPHDVALGGKLRRVHALHRPVLLAHDLRACLPGLEPLPRPGVSTEALQSFGGAAALHAG